jgi:hypothetical protein
MTAQLLRLNFLGLWPIVLSDELRNNLRNS